jgi:hypothetical protein
MPNMLASNFTESFGVILRPAGSSALLAVKGFNSFGAVGVPPRNAARTPSSQLSKCEV